jgi:hypothetical protein
MHVLAGDDVLVGIVERVLSDVTRDGCVSLAQRQLVAVALGEKRKDVSGFHEFCFCLQAMQTRVQGMAFSRAGAIGSPQSRQIP